MFGKTAIFIVLVMVMFFFLSMVIFPGKSKVIELQSGGVHRIAPDKDEGNSVKHVEKNVYNLMKNGG